MPVKNKRTLLYDAGSIALLLVLCLTVAWPRWRAQIEWGDEGFLAYSAVRVLHGEVPHRDFVSLQPPLSFYLPAMALELFGPSLRTLRALGVALNILLSLLVYAAARQLLRPALALAAAIPIVFLSIACYGFVPYAMWQGITVTMAAAAVYLAAVRTGRRAAAGVAGVLTAVALFLRHDQALYFALAVAVFAFALRQTVERRNSTRLFIYWLSGLAIVGLLLTSLAWVWGALPEMFQQLVVFPLTTYAKTSSLAFPHLQSATSVPAAGELVLFFLPPVIVAASVVWLLLKWWRRRFDFTAATGCFLTAWAGLFYCQVLIRSDLNHLLITLPPLFLLIAYDWKTLLDLIAKRAWPRRLLSVFAALAVAWFVWTVAAAILPDPSKATELLDLDSGGLKLENGRWLTDFVRGVQAYVPPERSILSLPYEPMLYFICQRHNPTRWNYIWPGDQTAAEHSALIGQAERDPPAVVFITGENDMALYASDILDYVHSHYRRAGEFGSLAVYLPNDGVRP